ncbi:MAG: YggT family protein [Bacillota bacterium]|nr:YggT family protein [Bacillota bacterium]
MAAVLLVLEVLNRTVNLFITVLWVLILVRALLSWFEPPGYRSWFYQLQRIVYLLTEPVLAPVRSWMRPVGIFDLSPLVVLFALFLVQQVVWPALMGVLLRIF